MGINIRAKGQTGEREIANALNPIVLKLLAKYRFPLPQADKPPIQRNQNQSAVGGADLVGTFGLAIEIKRQEALSVNTWWKQCTTQAAAAGEVPVLIYRQNGKPWRVVTMGALNLPPRTEAIPDSSGNLPYRATVLGARTSCARVEIDWPTFLEWFREWVDYSLQTRAQTHPILSRLPVPR